MNYIWEVIIKAKEGKKAVPLFFQCASTYSAYTELAMAYLNEEKLPEDGVIEVNPFYRFDHLFGDYFAPQYKSYFKDRELFFDQIMHLLAYNDLKQGLSKKAYYKKFIAEEVGAGCYGEEIKDMFTSLSLEEREHLLNGLLSLYKTGSNLTLASKMVHALFQESLVYVDKEGAQEVKIYIGTKKTDFLERKLAMLCELFLPIEVKKKIYWENHFGIMGVEVTMKIGEMVIG